MDILFSRLHDIPAYFRILVTSRPEQDVLDLCTKAGQGISSLRVDTIDHKSTDEDLAMYIQHELHGIIPDFKASLIPPNWQKQLVEKSEHLFQWAATACRYIIGSGGVELTPVERLTSILHRSHRGGLDKLYIEILEAFVNRGDDAGLPRFKDVVGLVLAAAGPLSIETLNELRLQVPTASNFVGDVRDILRPLGSLFSGVDNPSTAVRPLHTSLREFLIEQNRSKEFYIDFSQYQTALAWGCLSVMEKDLHFNMGKLPTSHLPNPNIDSGELRWQRLLPVYLRYACRSWGYCTGIII